MDRDQITPVRRRSTLHKYVGSVFSRTCEVRLKADTTIVKLDYFSPNVGTGAMYRGTVDGCSTPASSSRPRVSGSMAVAMNTRT